jgi:hypothetical protein
MLWGMISLLGVWCHRLSFLFLWCPFLLLSHFSNGWHNPTQQISCRMLIIFESFFGNKQHGIEKRKQITQLYIQILSLPLVRNMVSVPFSIKNKWNNNIHLSGLLWELPQGNVCERDEHIVGNG